MEYVEKTVNSTYIYKGKVINLRKDNIELPDGRTSVREIIEHNGGAAIAAVDESGRIALVKQYRKPFDEMTLEIPAGKLEKNEEPMVCAKRELEEEIGFKPLDIKFLAETYPTPGYSAEKIYIYFCNKMVKTQTNFDPDENIETIWVTFDEAIDLIRSGKLKDGKSISGVFLAREYMKTL